MGDGPSPISRPAFFTQSKTPVTVQSNNPTKENDIMRLLLVLSTSIVSTTAFQHAFTPRTSSSLSPLRLSPSYSPVHPAPRPKDANALYMSSNDVKQETSSGGTASIPNEIFNLVKSIVGAGVLSLPAGTLLSFIVSGVVFVGDGVMLH